MQSIFGEIETHAGMLNKNVKPEDSHDESVGFNFRQSEVGRRVLFPFSLFKV